MGIQDEIKQGKFSSSHEKAIINLVYTSNWFRDLQQKMFSRFGIKPQHFNILRILKGQNSKAISPGEIKEVMLDKSPDLTRLLDKLVSMGLIERELCPENRRKMDVRITKAGKEKVEEINNSNDEFLKGWNKRLSSKEADQLSELLDKVRG
jgi:DNA-binding MarR family transcriptional regulator